MTDWSAALAHAFQRHLVAEDESKQDSPASAVVGSSTTRAGPRRCGTPGTTSPEALARGVVPAEPAESQDFRLSGTTGTTGTTQIETDLHVSAEQEEADLFDERAAIVEDGAGVPRAWAEAFARLDLLARRQGESDHRWRQLMNDAGRFLDRWGVEAAKLGWSAIDVFGNHANRSPDGPTTAGLVPLIMGGTVVSIGHDRATICMSDGGSVVYLRRRLAGLSSNWERAEWSEPAPEGRQ
jgi:hypothetical protein